MAKFLNSRNRKPAFKSREGEIFISKSIEAEINSNGIWVIIRLCSDTHWENQGWSTGTRNNIQFVSKCNQLWHLAKILSRNCKCYIMIKQEIGKEKRGFKIHNFASFSFQNMERQIICSHNLKWASISISYVTGIVNFLL